MINELRKLLGEALHMPVYVLNARLDPYGDTQPRIIPPCSLKLGTCAYDALTLRHGRRQRPLRRDDVGAAEVFEQEVPRTRVRSPAGFKAMWHDARRHRGGNLGVEFHLVAACARPLAGTFRKLGLGDERFGTA